MSHRRSWQDGVNLILGLWIAVAPLAGFGGSAAAVLNSYVTGAVIAGLSAFALVRKHRWIEWVNTALGLWLLLSPVALDYVHHEQATWNHLMIGVWIIIDAIWSMQQRPSPRMA
jgi:hypothetical protein